ncbi:MAG TPA: glycosyltransferase [Acidobacteriaceae bacterium]|nr:glycosyltransferase [Acidobacteriaceae bacterium]
MTHWISIALGVLLVALTLPLTAELAILTSAFFLPRRRPACSAPSAGFELAVLVPAHNEELHVARTVESLRRAAKESDSRIVVIAHNCTDRTAERAAGAGAEVLVFDNPEARGKGFALRHGFEHVFSSGSGAALVVDADSTVSANLIDLVDGAFAAGAEAVQTRYEMTSAGDRGRGRLAALALRGFNLVRVTGRSRLGLSCGILGNGFAIRRSVFEEIPYRALSLVEDLEYHIHLVTAGKQVEFLEDAKVSAELPDSPAGETTQRSRWEGGRFSVARQWLLPLAGRLLRGRLRLAEPLADLAGLPIAYGAFLLLAALVVPETWVRLYAAAALAVLAFHVLTTAWAGGEFAEELRVLCTAPGYILWKLRLLPRLLRSSGSRAAWVRTDRAPAPRKA